MKVIYFLLTILLLVGTASPQKQRTDPDFVEIVKTENKVTDSLTKDFVKAANEVDRKTDLLIYEKKKADKENAYLKKENARLRLLISNKPDTVFFKNASFFKRLFQKRKSKRAMSKPSPEINLKKDAL